MAIMAAILKPYFELLLNRKANWLETWYEVLVWLVDKKIANILPIRNGWPPLLPFEILFWTSSPEQKSPIDLKLGRKYRGNL